MTRIIVIFFILLLMLVFAPIAVAFEDGSEYQAEENESIGAKTVQQSAFQRASNLLQVDSGIQPFMALSAQSQNINPLTGLPTSTNIANNRPIAVSFNNARAALPKFGISQADIIYEMLIEGGMTRMFALFQDISNVGYIAVYVA